MAMKESERSLRAYFLLAGCVSALGALARVGKASELSTLPASGQLAVCMPMISGIVLGMGFFIAGLKLKAALPRGAGWIKILLVASGALLFINGALATSVLGTHRGSGSITSA